MGIEGLALIVQGKSTIFETDLFAPLVESVLDLARPTAERRAIARRDARIVADHARALTFAIAEGALPGNEGAGYVLRRLLRRAVTRGRSRRGLALHRPFLADTAGRAIELFSGHYRELAARRAQVRAGRGGGLARAMDGGDRGAGLGVPGLPGAGGARPHAAPLPRGRRRARAGARPHAVLRRVRRPGRGSRRDRRRRGARRAGARVPRGREHRPPGAAGLGDGGVADR